MPPRLPRFQRGDRRDAVRAKLNALVDALNAGLSLRGDGIIEVSEGTQGSTVRLSVENLLPRIPKQPAEPGGWFYSPGGVSVATDDSVRTEDYVEARTDVQNDGGVQVVTFESRIYLPFELDDDGNSVAQDWDWAVILVGRILIENEVTPAPVSADWLKTEFWWAWIAEQFNPGEIAAWADRPTTLFGDDEIGLLTGYYVREGGHPYTWGQEETGREYHDVAIRASGGPAEKHGLCLYVAHHQNGYSTEEGRTTIGRFRVRQNPGSPLYVYAPPGED